MSRKFARNPLSHLVALCVAAGSLPAFAQDVAPVDAAQSAIENTKRQLEEVYVSARKTVDNMQDVSISVTAFSGATLDNLAIRDVREIEGLVPNLVIDSVSVAPAGASLYIRGVGTQEVERSFDPAVGVVVDGVPLSFVNGSMANTFDFESLEVLRGPQGTLFGRNTTGGVINITRSRPTGEFGARVEGTYGTDDLGDVKAVVNFPIVEDVLAGKVAYARQTGGGQRKNTTIGEDVGDADNREMNLTLLFSPSDKFDALFTYVNYEDKNDGVVLQNLNSANANNPVNPDPEALCDVPLNVIFPTACADGNVTDIENVTQDFYGQNVNFEADTYILNMQYDLGVGAVTTIIGYQETDERVPTDFDDTAVNFFHAIREQDSEQTSLAIRFASSDELSETFDFVAGVFAVEDEYSLEQNTSIGAFGGPDFSLFQNSFADHEREAWAVFGELHWNFTDSLMLTVGGRYTEEEKDYDGEIFFGGGALAPGLEGVLQGFVPGTPMDDLYLYGQTVWLPFGAASGNETWDEFSPKVGLDWRLNDDVLTYITYSEGFRSGGFNGRNQDPANIGPFDPEYVNNLELGFKSDLLDQTLRLNTAIFFNEYDDKQEEVIESDGFGGSNTVVRNAATVEIWGVESELTWVINEYLIVNGNFGYLDAQYDEYDADLTGDGIITDNSDLELRRVPEWTGGLNATFTLPVGPGDLSLYGSVRYTDEYYVEVGNDPRGLLDDRTVYDVILAYDTQIGDDSNLRVSLYGRDITDEVDYNSAVIIPGTLAFGAVSGGEQYGLRVNIDF